LAPSSMHFSTCSRSLSAVTLGFHLLLAVALAAYVEPPAFCLLSILLVLLLGWREILRMRQQGVVRLEFDSRTASIALDQGKQPYFYRKYKVYATRWFAILKLIDNSSTRTLILHSDRFDSIQSYRRIRRLLANPGQPNAA